jgi:hypothetical protein
MFYIIETRQQLQNLYCLGDECYINIIPLNDNYHSLLTSPSLIYFKTLTSKGYIFPINHSEGFSLELNEVLEWINRYNKIYTLNKKECLYYFPTPKLIDIPYKNPKNFNSLFSDWCYNNYADKPYVNSLIPISKHFEEQEKIFEEIKDNFNSPINYFYNETSPQVFKSIEEKGIKINREIFDKHFKYHNGDYFIKDDIIYTKYNLYNLTTRPTNSFNGINFAALNKNDGSRASFIPKNDYFFEFDYDAYHVRILAKLIDYQLDNESVHTQLGLIYFKKDELTDAEYRQSKELTFKQLYGGVFEQYKEIPFFKAMNEYIDTLWIKFKETNKLELIGGKVLQAKEIVNPSPNKLLNYIIQSAETYNNIISLKKVIEYLADKQSDVILYTYDSFLIDYAIKDGKETLKQIKQLLEQDGYIIKVEYGLNYDSLNKI